MSLRTDIKISTITKQDEAALADKYASRFASFEETFKPRKSVTQSKSRSPSKSPSKSPQKKPTYQDDSLEGLTRSQILAKLEHKEQEDEKEIDLNETSITGSNVRLAKSKNDLSRSLIKNLDEEVDNLKFKRSVVMAERDKMRKEQIKRALEDDNEDNDPRSAYSSGQQTKAWNVTSTVQKRAFENMNEVLLNHKEKMEAIEKEYQVLASDLVAKTTDPLERAKLVHVERGYSAPAKDKTQKENLKNYSKVDPPPLLNSYMNNPFLMRKKKETPLEKKKAQLKTIKNKRDDLKTYKERFLEYVEDKKVKVERGKEELSPDQIRKQGKMEFRLKAGTVKQMSMSPKRVNRAESPKQYKLKSSPSNHVLSPTNQSVKKLPPRRFSERKFRPTYGADTIYSDELFQLVELFLHMKRGEKPTANKDDIWNHIMRHPQDFDQYNVDLMNLRPNLYEFPSEFQNAMSLEEFIAFLRDPRAENSNIVQEVVKEIESLGGTEEVLREVYTVKKRKDYVRSIVDEKTIKEINKLHNKFENLCLLTEEQLDLFKQVFYRLVFSYDENKSINRLEFVQKLREDSEIQDLLNVPAVNVNEYNEDLKVEKILKQIENEYKRAPIKKKKARENITLAQFLKYFTNYELDRGLVEDETEETNYDDGDEVDVQKDRLQFFKEIFSSLPKDKSGLVETEGFIQYIYRTEFYKGVCGELAREKALLYELPGETIEQTMARVEKEGDLMISWDEFRQYFTRRGRPARIGLSITDAGSRFASKVLEMGKNEDIEAYKARLADVLEGEESDEDIDPIKSVNTKYVRYYREDKDVTLNKKSFKAALEAAEQERIQEEDYLKFKREEDEKKKAEELKKKVYGSKFGALYKESADFKITEPQPFSFDHRDKNRTKSIRERKLEEMLLEKEHVELEPLNVHFRANPIPAHVGEPLYDQIMQAQEARREKVRMESQAMTKAMENPFSFYERDLNKEKATEAPLNAEFDYKFQARDVPKNVLVRDLWHQMQEKDKVERAERIANRAQQNVTKVSLPPRMANSEKRREEKLEKEKRAPPKEEKKVFRANPVPDFENLHREFQDLLDAKRKSKQPTEPRGFDFQETRKGVKREYMNIDNQMKKAAKDQFKRDPFDAVKKLKSIKPKNQPPTTKKMLAMMDKLKADREEIEMRKIMKKMEEENRMAKYKKMKGKVQMCDAILDMAKEKEERDRLIKEEIKRTMRDNERRYQEEMGEIYARVDARPLLVEQEGEKNLRQAQERALREMMASEGRDPRLMDPLRHLTPEERAYYEQQAGYLRGPEEYGGVAEEEGEDEEEEEEEHQGQARAEGQEGEEGEEEDEEGQEYMTEEEYQQRLRYLQQHGYIPGHEYQQGQEEIEEEGEDEAEEEEEGEEYEGEERHHGQYAVEGEEGEEGEELEEQDYDDDYEN